MFMKKVWCIEYIDWYNGYNSSEPVSNATVDPAFFNGVIYKDKDLKSNETQLIGINTARHTTLLVKIVFRRRVRWSAPISAWQSVMFEYGSHLFNTVFTAGHFISPVRPRTIEYMEKRSVGLWHDYVLLHGKTSAVVLRRKIRHHFKQCVAGAFGFSNNKFRVAILKPMGDAEEWQHRTGKWMP